MHKPTYTPLQLLCIKYYQQDGWQSAIVGGSIPKFTGTFQQH